jgi:4-amino-4-deoxy-L-arabinose transferase-like glycosyltransferase
MTDTPTDTPERPASPLATLRALLLDPRAHLALLAACAALILFARAGAGPLPNYDDAYYGEKAKQMLRTGDWLTPRFAGLERLDNPPLFLWLMAGAFAVMGVSSFAAVFWSALAGVACVMLVHALARRIGRDPFEAWAAAMVLLGSGYFLKYANHAMFDVFLTALFLGAMLAYRRAWEGGARGWIALGALTGLGVLTKSALGLFPLIVAVLHTLWCGRGVRALRSGAWLAPLVAAAVPAPWYAYQLATHHDAFVSEHVAWLLFQRGFGSDGVARPADPFGYLREIALTYWPWLPAVVVGAVLTIREAFARPRPRDVPPGTDDWNSRASARLLLVWLVVVVGIMSFGREKKLWYVMSAFPALALVSAHAFVRAWHGPAARARIVIGGFALAATAGAVLALTPWGSAPPRRPDLQQMALAARAMVPADEPVTFLGGSYWSVAHQFVFHSDRTLRRGSGEVGEVRAALEAGGWALVSRGSMPELLATPGPRVVAVVSSGEWSLVHVAPAPAARLDPDALPR